MTDLTPRRELLRRRLGRFTRTFRCLARGDAKAVHRARVASRRLRELLPVLQLDPRVAVKLGRRLRKVTRKVGRVREIDMLGRLIGELRTSGRFEPAALDAVEAPVVEARQAEWRRLSETLGALRRIAAKLDDIAVVLGEDQRGGQRREKAWQWAVEARAARRAKDLRAALEEAGTIYSAKRLHAVRIAVKKLRYALEVSSEAEGLTTTVELRALKRGQTLLGSLHDRQVLVQQTQQVAPTATDATAGRALESLAAAIEDDCRRLHAQYLRVRPSLAAVCDRIVVSSRGSAGDRTRFDRPIAV